MDMERRLEVESLTRELQVLEREEQELREKIDMIAIKKSDLLKRIADYSDEKYEQDALTRLYEQRRGKQWNKIHLWCICRRNQYLYSGKCAGR